MTAFIWGCPVKTKLFVGTRQRWTRFLVGAVVLSILGVIGAHWFKDNYRIGIDYQQVTSVRNTNVFIVDLHDFELERGGLYLLCSLDHSPIYEECTPLAKYLMGLPGDTIKVDYNGVWINGDLVQQGFAAGIRLGIDLESLHGEKMLGEDEYWVLGDNSESFDSRYWGSLTRDRILNRVYPIW